MSRNAYYFVKNMFPLFIAFYVVTSCCMNFEPALLLTKLACLLEAALNHTTCYTCPLEWYIFGGNPIWHCTHISIDGRVKDLRHASFSLILMTFWCSEANQPYQISFAVHFTSAVLDSTIRSISVVFYHFFHS